MDRFTALAAHESRLYAGSENGVFVSGDGGNSWAPTSFNDSVSTLTVDEDTVYAGTWSQGVFRSDDAGVTWKPIRDGLRLHEHAGERYYGNVRHILVTDNNIINVMYHSGTYTSTDRGEIWHDISTEWMGGNSIHLMTEFDGYLWSAVSSGSMFAHLITARYGKISLVLPLVMYMPGRHSMGGCTLVAMRVLEYGTKSHGLGNIQWLGCQLVIITNQMHYRMS